MHRKGKADPILKVYIFAAIWDCDSYKSPCLDGINFSVFWRNFGSCWIQFHSYGKLVKSPIVPSPKNENQVKLGGYLSHWLGVSTKCYQKFWQRPSNVITTVIEENKSTFTKKRYFGQYFKQQTTQKESKSVRQMTQVTETISYLQIKLLPEAQHIAWKWGDRWLFNLEMNCYVMIYAVMVF